MGQTRLLARVGLGLDPPRPRGGKGPLPRELGYGGRLSGPWRGEFVLDQTRVATDETVAGVEQLASHLESLADYRQHAISERSAAPARARPIPGCDSGRLDAGGKGDAPGGQAAGDRPPEHPGAGRPHQEGERPAQSPDPGAADLRPERVVPAPAEASREVESAVAGPELSPSPLTEPEHRRVVPCHVGVDPDHQPARPLEPPT